MKIITRYQNLCWRIADIISFSSGNNGDKIEKIREALDKKPTMEVVDEAIEEFIALQKDIIRLDNANTEKSSRIHRARKELESMIDGGEECRGKDSQISYIMQILMEEI